jgi:hypothetical protein
MMSDNDIRKGFQSKLSGFEAPVPPDGWESVERSLKAAAAARTVLRRRWYAGAVAAVLVLLIGSRLFMRNPAEQTETMPSESIAMTPLTDSRTEPLTASGELPSEPVVSPADAGRLSATRTGKEPVVRPAAPGGILSAWLERKKLQTKRTDEIDDNALRLLAEKNAQHSKKLYAEEVLLVGGDDEILFAGGILDERGEGTLLLAVNGRGGLTGYQQTVNTPMTLRSANASSPEYQSEIDKFPIQAANTAENISEMEHDMPASFGITVSKHLTDDLSLETGLVYSYLHSKTRNANNNFRIEEVQKLHYLGIPLNVNYNIFSLKRLNVYASVGGMAEKDIYGEFQKVREGQAISLNNESEESEEYVKTKISQRNLQISVNAGIGLSYPLYDRLRLYGKVGGAYYFDAKNEHKTIYSDRKIVMDLNVGLRYEF